MGGSPPQAPSTGQSKRERIALASFLGSPPMAGRAVDLHMIQGLEVALALSPLWM
jgi:hypothetical protein